MVFLDTPTKQGLVEDVDFLCQSDSSSYPTADKTRNINRHYYKAVIDILRSTGRWQFDDTNQTDLPILTTDLVASQVDYALPTNILKLQAVEVKDDSGDWVRLKEIDQQELTTTITDFEDTPSIPRYYDVKGSSVFLYPAASATDTTLTAGLKLYISRELDLFTAADTTKEPGFAEPFHRILSLGAAYDWLVINGTQDRADRVLAQFEQLRNEMREFYGDRNRDTRTSFRVLPPRYI